VYIVVKKDGLRLVIELNEQEAADFRRLAKTKDRDYLDGIAKSLVLGAGEIVDPKSVLEDIELLNNIRSYGLRGDLAPKQEWADALSFSLERLGAQAVKDGICSWAVHFESDLKEIIEARWTSMDDQVWWFRTNARTSTLLNSLRMYILEYLSDNGIAP
jgi:hypothetical protein